MCWGRVQEEKSNITQESKTIKTINFIIVLLLGLFVHRAASTDIGTVGHICEIGQRNHHDLRHSTGTTRPGHGVLVQRYCGKMSFPFRAYVPTCCLSVCFSFDSRFSRCTLGNTLIESTVQENSIQLSDNQRITVETDWTDGLTSR